MKHLYCLAVLLGLGQPAAARLPGLPAPPDTIPGHGQLVRTISDSLCTRLEKRRQEVDFRQLSASQSGHLLKDMVNQLVRENRLAVENVVYAVRATQQDRYKRQLGRDIVLHLAEHCIIAHQVLADISYTSLHDKAPLPPAEHQILLAIAWRISQRLTEEDRSDPLEERTPAAEKQCLVQTMQACLREAEPALSSYYGAGVLADPARLRNVSERLNFVLLNLSPKYVLMLTPRY